MISSIYENLNAPVSLPTYLPTYLHVIKSLDLTLSDHGVVDGKHIVFCLGTSRQSKDSRRNKDKVDWVGRGYRESRVGQDTQEMGEILLV